MKDKTQLDLSLSEDVQPRGVVLSTPLYILNGDDVYEITNDGLENANFSEGWRESLDLNLSTHNPSINRRRTDGHLPADNACN